MSYFKERLLNENISHLNLPPPEKWPFTCNKNRLGNGNRRKFRAKKLRFAISLDDVT
uniref:Uncharacterized protein n=1 Tax=Rhizophagus irregularis (strain DAOM 181602 / DAOM 197198 / MUCL 43194) TaxID=747089 RepID=U9TSL2_RHIID